MMMRASCAPIGFGKFGSTYPDTGRGPAIVGVGIGEWLGRSRALYLYRDGG